MMRRHLIIIGLWVCGTGFSVLHASDGGYLLQLTSDKRVPVQRLLEEGYTPSAAPLTEHRLSPEDRYTPEKGYGYDLLASPDEGGNRPYYVSVQVPDGNYRVTVLLGNRKEAGVTTVRAESRRLFLESVPTKKGEFRTFTFTVNKRTSKISDTEAVRIKPRERSKLNWDDKLTIEVNGDRPQCAAIRIEPDHCVPTLFLTGNSTVVDQDEEPWASWGQMIPRFFDAEVCFANYAESGECADTFIRAGRLKKALSQMKPGDYMFMEFGPNDQKQNGPGRGAYYSFATSLKTFIDEVRQRGGHPVLVTPTCRRAFKDGKIRSTHADYPDAVHWVAEREQVPLIDLQEMTRVLFEALGEEGSKRAFVHYPAGTYPGQAKALADNTHFNPYGAYQIARCVVEGMKQARLPFVDHLREDVQPFRPSVPDSPDAFHWDESLFVEMQKPDGN